MMVRNLSRRHKKGQNLIEYAVVLAGVAIAMIAVGRYFNSKVQGRWRESATQFSGTFYEEGAPYSFQSTHGNVTTQVTGAQYPVRLPGAGN